MSAIQLDRSPDLKRLRDNGYEVQVTAGGHLVVSHVPYVTTSREIDFGSLVCPLTVNGDITTTPQDHVVMFIGSTPCDSEGQPLAKVLNASDTRTLEAGLVINHTFSSKPREPFPDFYEKMISYIRILFSQAKVIDQDVTAQTYRPIEASEQESVFRYIDSASSRAGIGAITNKLDIAKVAIVGVGGTGSYILDLVAKTPVGEIHIFDDDRFLQHNAFRAPGAPDLATLNDQPSKVMYWQAIYGRMHRHIIPHDYRITVSNVDELCGMGFVFIALDSGEPRKVVVEYLQQQGIPFIDVGMGVYEADGALAGTVRVVRGSPGHYEHVASKAPLTKGAAEDDYLSNIQIAELNALNAALAVIKWKKHFGFYVDLDRENYSAYTLIDNHLLNEDRS